MQLSDTSVCLSAHQVLLVDNKFFVGPVPNPYLKCRLTCIASGYKHVVHRFGNT